MTDRLLKAIANPNTSLIGHPTGRLLLRREAYQFDLDAVLKTAANTKSRWNSTLIQTGSTSVTCICVWPTAWCEDRHNTDSHHTSHMGKMRYGILQARRAWLTKDDVLNALPAREFAKAMKHAW